MTATQEKVDIKTQFTQADLKHLISLANQVAVCISIYCPTHRAGTEIQQDPIRLKNLVRQAETQLTERGLDADAVANFFQPIRALFERGSEDEFWQHQDEGLACFATADQLQIYQLSIPVEAQVFVGDRFYLKPLVPMLMGDGRYFLLALSQNQVRLMEGNRDRIREVDLAGVPGSLAEALKYDVPEKSTQFHTGSSGDVRPIYHGHGVGTTDDKNEIRRYFQEVNRGIQNILNTESAPLVLAGVEYLLPIYSEVSDYPNVLSEFVVGNPDTLTPEELHEQAWRIVQPYFQRSRQEAIAAFHTYRGTGQATNQMGDIIPAAYHGQVDILFVTANQQQWGQFEPHSNQVELHSQREPGDDELLNLATLATLADGGTVYTLEPEQMPAEGAIAAIFRYPIVSGKGH
jgi:hypothetical protein